MRGEHQLHHCLKTRQLGPPPHARGTPRALDGTVVGMWDHPRMRGEHALIGLPQ